MTFAEALRKHRSELGISHGELAQRVGCSKRWLFWLESGADPKLSLAQKIAVELKFSLDALNSAFLPLSTDESSEGSDSKSDGILLEPRLVIVSPRSLLSACCREDVFVSGNVDNGDGYYVCNKCSKVCELFSEAV